MKAVLPCELLLFEVADAVARGANWAEMGKNMLCDGKAGEFGVGHRAALDIVCPAEPMSA